MERAKTRRQTTRHTRLLSAAALAALALAACGGEAVAHSHGTGSGTTSAGTGNATVTEQPARSGNTTVTGTTARKHHGPVPLPDPHKVRPFASKAAPRQGDWHWAGRKVHGLHAVFVTKMVPPGGTREAGIAWMDPRLLYARLYSGSESPGGGPYKLTAPIQRKQARTLVAAFNGGFKEPAAQGGYYTQGRQIVPLRDGAASFVIYRDGRVKIGTWGRHLKLTKKVVAVRQNLVLLVAHHRPTPLAGTSNWLDWGATCGAYSCSGAGIENQWRSAAGITKNGALIYVQGPDLTPLQLARVLARAGAATGMELDINPDWPIFATYDPKGAHGLASPANGTGLLPGTVRGVDTFFDPSWARDFFTMSARKH